MHELLVAFQSQGVHLLLDDVLDGLDVVVRHRLDLLHTLGVGGGEIGVERPQGGEFRAVDVGQLRQRQLAQGDEILHFDTDPVADQGLFRKIIGEFFRFVAVASVDGRDGGKRRQHIWDKICFRAPNLRQLIEIRIFFATFAGIIFAAGRCRRLARSLRRKTK